MDTVTVATVISELEMDMIESDLYQIFIIYVIMVED